ncbi:MAG: ATP-binding protein [Gemmatimonadaceae bacterium]
MRAALIAAGVALLLAMVFDQWYQRELENRARARVRVVMAPYASALQAAVQRRVALLAGLRSFADSRQTRRALNDEFPLFAQGILLGTDGVRALQFVENGRIVMTWPLDGNESALGYDLTSDPRPVLGADVRRAVETGGMIVTGPVQLVQGGTGLLVRQRIAPRAGFPDLAAIILDLPAIVTEAGVPTPSSGLRLEIRDSDSRAFAGDAAGVGEAPESMVVAVPDGDWSLVGAPTDGWASMVRAPLAGERVTALALILVAGLLGYVLGGRQERLAREVAESGTRLDLALRAGRMGAWEFDVPTNRVIWSEAAAAIFGYEPWELDGDPSQFFARIHSDDGRALRRLVDEMLSGTRREYVTEFRVLLPDESVRWVLAIGELERDASGRPKRMLGVISDASERREIEERLRHSQRLEAVGTLAGGVAHDFNNLLTAIIGFTELAQDRAAELGKDPAGEAIHADLRQVLMTADRAANLTAQLLAFSRRKSAEPTHVDLSEAVRELEPMLRRLLGDGNEFCSELTPGLTPAWVDSGKLTQVLVNLVVNARDAMPHCGTVTVRTYGVRAAGSARPLDAPAGEWICLEVADSGVGMRPELQARIFEPYFTTKEIGRGTGLGLAVVYGVVENAGGQVTVNSVLGEGTVFRIYLPLRRVTGEHPTPLGVVSATV